MDQNLTDITVILDRSGSMASIADDVVGGVNDFIHQQKEATGKARFTLVQFDSQNPYEVIHDAVNVQHVGELQDYHPRATTPLLDAVGTGIVRTGERLAAMPEDERPGQVVFVIVTDGAENASREYTRERVREMIKTQEERYNWSFVFLAADQQAFNEAGAYGFDANTSLRVGKTGGGIRRSMSATAANVTQYRQTGDKMSMEYTDRQKGEQLAEIASEA